VEQQLRGDQHRQRNEEAHIHIDIEQERNANGIAPCQPFGHG